MRVGNYTLSSLLGRGGTSEVYAAEHRFLGDAVAVKLLRRSLAEDERMRDAFLAEAARTREIEHPNVVRVLDFGHDDTTGSCYLVMERIDGDSLAVRLRERGQVSEAELRPLAAAIADGMQAAHARGIVHRDLKPGNVMLRGDAPTIVDFGIAKSLGATSAVVTERRIGTVAYMAPEQLTDGLITPAVDIWALGVVMYEAVTGQPPFLSFDNGRLPQLFDTPPRPATLAPVSAALDALIMRCLERDPGKRPASMAEIARVLRGGDDERVTADIGSIAPTPTPTRPVANRKRWPLIALVAAATLATATVVAIAIVGRSEPAASMPADAGVAEQSPTRTLTPTLTPTPTLRPEPDAGREEVPPRRTKRARPQRPRTTSQGETLD